MINNIMMEEEYYMILIIHPMMKINILNIRDISKMENMKVMEENINLKVKDGFIII